MLKVADHLVFISDIVRRELLASIGNRSHVLLYNGVDTEIFRLGKKDCRQHIVTRYSLPRDRPIILFVGRFVEKKGLGVLRSLAARRPELFFVLVGSGPIDATKWGLTNVRSLGPLVPQKLADVYRGADLLLLPSVGEGFPLVIQEAMACGLPVICGKESAEADPAASKWLRGVNIDLSASDESARRCAQAYDTMTMSTEERLQMANYAASAYSWENMAKSILSTLDDLTP